jgi:hypothetical protein
VSVFSREITALTKSPGGWFFASNAVLYTQTDLSLAFFYLMALVLQRVCHHYFNDKKTNYFVNLIAGWQGILAVNGMITLCAALTTALISVFPLAVSGLVFGIASITQSVVYSAPEKKFSPRVRHWILAMCEFLIAIGFAFIAVNAGYSMRVSFGLVVPVVVAGVIRGFYSRLLPPGLAYADMMFMGMMTGYQAILTGNIANAVSRLLVLFGLTRLAVLRARNEGKVSLFEVERYF